MDLRKSTSTKKKMALTLAALAADEEKKKEKETFANTSGPQAAHSWTSVMSSAWRREKNSAAQELHLAWHLPPPQLSHKLTRSILFNQNKFTGLQQSAASASGRRLVCHVLLPKDRSRQFRPVLPPRQSGRHWSVAHPGDHLCRGEEGLTVYRRDQHSSLSGLRSLNSLYCRAHYHICPKESVASKTSMP